MSQIWLNLWYFYTFPSIFISHLKTPSNQRTPQGESKPGVIPRFLWWPLAVSSWHFLVDTHRNWIFSRGRCDPAAACLSCGSMGGCFGRPVDPWWDWCPWSTRRRWWKQRIPRNGKGYVPCLKLAAGIAPENRGFPPGFWEIPHLETIFF